MRVTASCSFEDAGIGNVAMCCLFSEPLWLVVRRKNAPAMPKVISCKACYLGCQESLTSLAKLVEAEVAE